MNIDQQIVTALAQKAQLRDQLDALEKHIGQLVAVKQCIEAMSAPVDPAPEPTPEA